MPRISLSKPELDDLTDSIIANIQSTERYLDCLLGMQARGGYNVTNKDVQNERDRIARLDKLYKKLSKRRF